MIKLNVNYEKENDSNVKSQEVVVKNDMWVSGTKNNRYYLNPLVSNVNEYNWSGLEHFSIDQYPLYSFNTTSTSNNTITVKYTI